MTATAFAFEPELDFFDNVDAIAPARPQLRLIQGGGYGTTLAGTQPTPPASVETYRRRRFLTLVVLSVAIVAIAWAAGLSVLSFGGTANTAAVSEAPAVHIVLPGDSYAAIAADLGAANPVAVADQMRVANGGAELVVGQRLVVDVSSLVLAAG